MMGLLLIPLFLFMFCPFKKKIYHEHVLVFQKNKNATFTKEKLPFILLSD